MRTENESGATEYETTRSNPDLDQTEYETVCVEHKAEIPDTAQLIPNTESSNQDHRIPFVPPQGNSKLVMTDPDFTSADPKLSEVAGRDDRLFEIRNDPSADPVARTQTHLCCCIGARFTNQLGSASKGLRQ